VQFWLGVGAAIFGAYWAGYYLKRLKPIWFRRCCLLLFMLLPMIALLSAAAIDGFSKDAMWGFAFVLAFFPILLWMLAALAGYTIGQKRSV
jgi:hypothetical protein